MGGGLVGVELSDVESALKVGQESRKTHTTKPMLSFRYSTQQPLDAALTEKTPCRVRELLDDVTTRLAAKLELFCRKATWMT